MPEIIKVLVPRVSYLVTEHLIMTRVRMRERRSYSAPLRSTWSEPKALVLLLSIIVQIVNSNQLIIIQNKGQQMKLVLITTWDTQFTTSLRMTVLQRKFLD